MISNASCARRPAPCAQELLPAADEETPYEKESPWVPAALRGRGVPALPGEGVSSSPATPWTDVNLTPRV